MLIFFSGNPSAFILITTPRCMMGLLQRSAPPRMCLCLHSIEINARIKGKRVEIPNSQVLFPRGPFLRGLCGSGSPLACADIAAFALLGTLVYVAMAGTSAPWPWPEPPGQRKIG